MTNDYQFIYGKSNADKVEGLVPNPNRRMTVSESVKMSNSIWDSRTGRLLPDADEERRRRRVQGMAIELNQLNEDEALCSKWAQWGVLGKRISLSAAMIFLMALFVLCGMFTLSHRSSLQDWNDKYEIAMRGVAQVREENEAIQQRIDNANQEGDIAYRAVELGMIRAGEAHTIPLSAVDAYPQQAVQTGYTAEVVVDGWGEMEEPAAYAAKAD